MKKAALFLTAGIIASALLAQGYKLGTGFGKKVAVTTAAQTIEITEPGVDRVYATCVSIYNEGTSTVFCAVNCDEITFAKKIADETAVQIPSLAAFQFKGTSLINVILQTTNGTATALIGACAE